MDHKTPDCGRRFRIFDDSHRIRQTSVGGSASEDILSSIPEYDHFTPPILGLLSTDRGNAKVILLTAESLLHLCVCVSVCGLFFGNRKSIGGKRSFSTLHYSSCPNPLLFHTPLFTSRAKQRPRPLVVPSREALRIQDGDQVSLFSLSSTIESNLFDPRSITSHPVVFHPDCSHFAKVFHPNVSCFEE